MSKNLIVIIRCEYANAVINGVKLSLTEFRRIEQESFYFHWMKLAAKEQHFKTVLKKHFKLIIKKLLKIT